MIRKLCIFALVSILSGCATTYEYDKKRVVIFTFGLGMAIISDKEGEGKIETKAGTVPDKAASTEKAAEAKKP